MISVPIRSEMDNDRLDVLIREASLQVEGSVGRWHFRYLDLTMICFSDEGHDRMRIMTPIISVDEVDHETLMTCMKANFSQMLEARYCVSDATLWAAFLHPLSSLTDKLFLNACDHVSKAARTFGTTFRSSEISFNDLSD